MHPMEVHMKKWIALALMGLALVLPARAAIFTGTLLGSAENPPNASPGSGDVVVTFDLVAHTLRVQASFADLVAGVTAAHIHCCALPTANAGVASPVPTFPGFPSGVMSGTYDMTFDTSLATSWNPAYITNNGGTTAGAEAALYQGLLDGMAYFNIHTSTYPGGELRANLALVPEPSTYAFLLAGLALMAVVARRRAR
jgi:hypothetical protein